MEGWIKEKNTSTKSNLSYFLPRLPNVKEKSQGRKRPTLWVVTKIPPVYADNKSFEIETSGGDGPDSLLPPAGGGTQWPHFQVHSVQHPHLLRVLLLPHLDDGPSLRLQTWVRNLELAPQSIILDLDNLWSLWYWFFFCLVEFEMLRFFSHYKWLLHSP